MDNGALIEGIGKGTPGSIVMARIPIGVDLHAAIVEAAARAKIQKGLILSGIGALQRAVFRNLKVFPQEYPVEPKDRIYLEVQGPLEILSLSGYIVPRLDGQTHVHAHFSASGVKDANVVVYGGHLDAGTITHVKAMVALCPLEDLPMGKKWVEERKTEDLWVGTPD